MRVVNVERTSQHYHDGDSVHTGYTVTLWDGERETFQHYGADTAHADLPPVDTVAQAAWREVKYAERQARERVQAECHATETALNAAYHVTQGRTCRVIKGRKVPVGTVLRCESRPQPSAYRNGQWSVATPHGWTDTDNLEVVPDGFPDMRCPGCEVVRAGADYLFSGWDGFGRVNRGVEWCRHCAADRYSGFQPGTAGHTLALAVLAGDRTAVCPLVDAMIEDGRDADADSLKRLHKLDKPVRKPRRKAVAAG